MVWVLGSRKSLVGSVYGRGTVTPPPDTSKARQPQFAGRAGRIVF